MIQPITHRIVVKLISVEEADETYAMAKKIAGFEIVQDLDYKKRAARSVDEGTVVSFGNTAFRDFNVDNPLHVGDRIVFAKGAAKIVADPADGKEYAVINDEDVVAILSK